MRIYGFVIMPNHLHLIFEMTGLNGKELPHASFLKFTAHKFQSYLRTSRPNQLGQFKVSDINKKYCFWQRDSLSVELFSPKVIFQKLEYLHNNPCKGKWQLSKSPENYKFSSFSFYESGTDEFKILTHIHDRM